METAAIGIVNVLWLFCFVMPVGLGILLLIACAIAYCMAPADNRRIPPRTSTGITLLVIGTIIGLCYAIFGPLKSSQANPPAEHNISLVFSQFVNRLHSQISAEMDKKISDLREEMHRRPQGPQASPTPSVINIQNMYGDIDRQNSNSPPAELKPPQTNNLGSVECQPKWAESLASEIRERGSNQLESLRDMTKEIGDLNSRITRLETGLVKTVVTPTCTEKRCADTSWVDILHRADGINQVTVKFPLDASKGRIKIVSIATVDNQHDAKNAGVHICQMLDAFQTQQNLSMLTNPQDKGQQTFLQESFRQFIEHGNWKDTFSCDGINSEMIVSFCN